MIFQSVKWMENRVFLKKNLEMGISDPIIFSQQVLQYFWYWFWFFSYTTWRKCRIWQRWYRKKKISFVWNSLIFCEQPKNQRIPKRTIIVLTHNEIIAWIQSIQYWLFQMKINSIKRNTIDSNIESNPWHFIFYSTSTRTRNSSENHTVHSCIIIRSISWLYLYFEKNSLVF